MGGNQLFENVYAIKENHCQTMYCLITLSSYWQSTISPIRIVSNFNSKFYFDSGMIW